MTRISRLKDRWRSKDKLTGRENEGGMSSDLKLLTRSWQKDPEGFKEELSYAAGGTNTEAAEGSGRKLQYKFAGNDRAR